MNAINIASKTPGYTPPLLLFCCLAMGALLASNAPVDAQTFAYTNCDLVAGFRMAGGASDLVVNLGPVKAFENLAPRSIVPITALSAVQLADAFPTFDGVSWSVAAAMRGNTNFSMYPLQTIWVTSPRPTIYTPGLIWNCQSRWTLGGAASQIDAIGVGAATYGNGVPAGTDNSAKGILIPPANQYAYSYMVGSGGDYSGTFQGSVENTTPDDFDTVTLPSRSVLYKLTPTTSGSEYAPGAVIGFFDFNADGSLTFTAGPPPEPATITKITSQASVTTVWFSTVNLVGYKLRYTNAAGLSSPISTWNTGSTLIGNGSTLSLTDTTSTSTRFYAVEASY